MSAKKREPSVWVVEAEGMDGWFVWPPEASRAYTARYRARDARTDAKLLGFTAHVREYRRVPRPARKKR